MNVDLKGKIAVVTGASRGLGRKVAVRLAKHDAKVAIVGRDANQLREAEAEVRKVGTGTAIRADVATIEGVAELKKQVESKLGTPQILINAAGIFGPIQIIKDSDPRRWIETLQINTIGPYLTCRAFVDGMIKQGWGRIVNFTSAASLHLPGPLNSAYGTSKVAVNQFTRHLAVELANTGVTANVIHPGDVKTDMWAAIRDEANSLGPEADAYRQWVAWVDKTGGDDPEKAADLVLNLMSDAAAKTTGRFLWIDEPLQKPIPSWGDTQDDRPWK
jgi:NAD(P)-dependent dehydrogenase (short-subunit alcohol dehydrogenase family)